jgi:hypothetical protein
MIHNAVSISTIRFCGTGKPVLANFDNFLCTTTEQTSNSDLECLGSAVLECMNGAPKKELRNLEEVRRLRDSNKTFGLDNGEKWSGSKLLVDFLDNMFNKQIPAIAKLEKPVGTDLTHVFRRANHCSIGILSANQATAFYSRFWN